MERVPLASGAKTSFKFGRGCHPRAIISHWKDIYASLRRYYSEKARQEPAIRNSFHPLVLIADALAFGGQRHLKYRDGNWTLTGSAHPEPDNAPCTVVLVNGSGVSELRRLHDTLRMSACRTHSSDFTFLRMFCDIIKFLCEGGDVFRTTRPKSAGSDAGWRRKHVPSPKTGKRVVYALPPIPVPQSLETYCNARGRPLAGDWSGWERQFGLDIDMLRKRCQQQVFRRNRRHAMLFSSTPVFV